MVTWDGPTWEDYENEQRRLGLELPADTNLDDTDPHMELWVSRTAMETVVRAAMTLDSRIGDVGNPISIVVRHAVGTVQEAVKDAWEDPLDATPL